MFVVAFTTMRDLGFTPSKGTGIRNEMQRIVVASMRDGWRVPSVKWLMLSSPFLAGVQIYVFYALQPYLLKLYGNPKAYGIAGLVAAIVAGAQIAGGLAAPWVRKLFHRRTTAVVSAAAASAVILAAIGLIRHFWAVVVLIVLWGLIFAATTPIRQAYMNGMIPSAQRATILSFDSMLGSAGGVVAQPALGRSADVWGYGASYVIAGGLNALAVPFIWLSRRHSGAADTAVSPATAVHPVTAE
jgi:MFS family permease